MSSAAVRPLAQTGKRAAGNVGELGISLIAAHQRIRSDSADKQVDRVAGAWLPSVPKCSSTARTEIDQYRSLPGTAATLADKNLTRPFGRNQKSLIAPQSSAWTAERSTTYGPCAHVGK